MQKSIIRKKIRKTRESLHSEFIAFATRRITSKLLSLSDWTSSKTVCIYGSSPNEIGTDDIIKSAFSDNKKLFIPRVENDRNLSLREVHCIESDLETSFGGIRQPKDSCKTLKDYTILDLIIVPGLAFDLSGSRIGFGMGYYDRLIKCLPKNIPIIALAFDFQVFRKIPCFERDQKVQNILTESNFYKQHSIVFSNLEKSDMQRLGYILAHNLKPPLCIGLIGELGSGKTFLVNSTVRSLEQTSTEEVISPTFTLLREYNTSPKVFHFDAYRLEEPSLSPIDGLQIQDIINQKQLFFIEWADRIYDELPNEAIEIKITGKGMMPREVILTSFVQNQHNILNNIERGFYVNTRH